MRVVVLPTADDVSRRAAEIIVACVQKKSKAVLGLATGGTPLGTYCELINAYRMGKVSFRDVTTFNLDEYVGLEADHPQSYRHFMREHLFVCADFDNTKCHVPDGMAGDYDEYCASYERMIRDAGGIDLQLLGIGTDGHIAFNEPGSSLASRMRLKGLTEGTRVDNSRFFAVGEEVPYLAVTMGVGTILEARRVLLLATGANKANAVRAFIEGPVTAQVTASALQLHPHVTVLLDEPAAEWLQRREYYDEVERIQLQVEQRQPIAQARI
jgi:glucosamine-6-phosphate deaminase